MGGMGGAQPLAATMAGACFLGIDVDPQRIEKRIETGYCDRMADDLDDALACWMAPAAAARALGRPGRATARTLFPELVRRGVVPDILTDQTSAHDRAERLRAERHDARRSARACAARDPDEYLRRSIAAMGEHVRAMLALKRMGAVTFDYGNNIRTQAKQAGVEDAFDIPGFVPEYIRPLFCEGRGPFRWAALSGDPEDILATDKLALELFPAQRNAGALDAAGARKRIHFQGLPARICWLGYGERAEFGMAMNDLVQVGARSKAPIVIGRDHLDAGSVASPYRETEGMRTAPMPSPIGRCSTRW